MGKPATPPPAHVTSYDAWRRRVIRQRTAAAGAGAEEPTGAGAAAQPSIGPGRRRTVLGGVGRATTPPAGAGGPDTRRLRYIISTPDVDRYNDTIDPAGWVWANWVAGGAPVFFNHLSWDLPVAQGVEIGLENGALVSTADFGPAGADPFVDRLFELCAAGRINGASVGFIPLEWSFDDERGGLNIKRAELVEWSLTPIPANAAAVQLARAVGWTRAGAAPPRRRRRVGAAAPPPAAGFNPTPELVRAATRAAFDEAVQSVVAQATGRLDA